MSTKYNIKDLEKLDNSSENTIKFQKNFPNNFKILNDKNISRTSFFNKDNGKFLNIDYIPKELFSSFMFKNQKDNTDNKVPLNNIQNVINNDSNNMKTSYYDNKNNVLKYSIKNENNNDFKISQNEFNISDSYNKSDNIFNSNKNSNTIQNVNSNLHLTGNIYKETNSNQRYHEEINQSNSKNKNINLNNNINNNINSNILSNKSSILNQNLSNYNGLSDNFINSHLNISNTLTNNSNFISSQNNYLEKIKLRELDEKEKFLIELESKRNKNITDLIEKQKIEFQKRIMDLQNMNKKVNDNLMIEKVNINISDQKLSNPHRNNENVICNNNNIYYKKIDNQNNLNKTNEIFSYFNKMKQEKIKVRRNSNHSTNLNYRTSTSFYTKRTKILSPFISSAATENNKDIRQNYTSSNFKKIQQKKKSKSTKKLNSSQKKIANSSCRLMKSLRSNGYNPNDSLQVVNLFKYFKTDNKNKQIKRNNFYNPKGKEKIQDKYNIYFNCFIPSLYEEQKQKLINEKNIKKSKSTTKIKKLEDYIGPNLYNEKVESPDFGYICYKTNKKINPNYSLYSTYNNSINYHLATMNNINTLNNEHYALNLSLRNIYNNYENNKNNYENENDIMNYPSKYNNFRNKNNYLRENQNYPRTEYNEDINNERIYQYLYNKAFNKFNYPSDSYYQQNLYNENTKWNLS